MSGTAKLLHVGTPWLQWWLGNPAWCWLARQPTFRFEYGVCPSIPLSRHCLCKLHSLLCWCVHMGSVSGSWSVILQSTSQLPTTDSVQREHFPQALYLIIIYHGVPHLLLAAVRTGSQAGGSPVVIRSGDFSYCRSQTITFPEAFHHGSPKAVLTQAFPPWTGGRGLPHPSSPQMHFLQINIQVFWESLVSCFGNFSFLWRWHWAQTRGDTANKMSCDVSFCTAVFPLSPTAGATRAHA